jgi:hypothetical protein
MVYKSKIDWWLILIFLGIPAWNIAAEWMKRGTMHPPDSFWLIVAVQVLLVIALTPIRYVIEGRTVSVKCGVIGWEYAAFSVDDVQSIRPTFNPLASPALSLSRLNIDLGVGGNLLISPRNKNDFLRAMEALDSRLQLREGSLVRGS